MGQTRTEQKEAASKPECGNTGSCHSKEQDCRCHVLELVDDTILAVRPPPEMKCSHKMRYRDAFLCTSPARKEIYKRSQA